MTPGRTRLLLAGAVVAGVAEVWLAHESSGPTGILERRYGLLGVIAAWTVAYAVAVFCVLRLPLRWALGLVLLLAVVLRVYAFAPKAPLSDDLYRYAWDGVVQTAGIDPYRYPPTAPELEHLRDPWLWPAQEKFDDNGTQINRPDVRTIYPPVAEAWFALEHLVVPLSARDLGYERVGLLIDLAILSVLLALLRDRRWVALYALAPLPVLEVVQNAHVDGLAVLLALAALALSERRRPMAAVVVLALATLTKIYPALLGLVGLLGPAATVVAALLLLALAVWALRTTLPLREAAVLLMSGVLLVVTPVQPWYAVLLLALATLARTWWVVPLAFAAYPLFFASILDGPAPLYGRISYGLAALALAAGYRTRSNRSPYDCRLATTS